MAINLDSTSKSVSVSVSAGDVAQIQYEEGYPAHYIINQDGTNQKVVTAVFMGQSEIEYLFNVSGFYNQITKPTITNANCYVVRQTGNQVAPVITQVTQANVDNASVSYTIAAIAEVLGTENPDVLYVIGDCAVAGTSRFQLSDDSLTQRYWSDFTSVVNLIEGTYGPVQHLIECWFNSDAAYIQTFKNNFWPVYFGINPDGSEFTLGQSYTLGDFTYNVDNCLWDAQADINEKGRGIFTQAGTSWHILTPMPFSDGAETGTADLQFTNGNRNEEPTRQIMHLLEGDAQAQKVRLVVGPSAHISDFNGGIHPIETDPDGQILLGMSFIAPLLRANRQTVGEPEITEVTGPTDGTFAELTVSLPNGGNLTTLRQLRQISMPVTPSPHQQTVTGLEVFRASGSTRRPIVNTSETSFPVEERGTVTITDSGSGAPRTGTIRITPSTPFGFGDSLSYLRGQATAMLLESRDVPNKLFLDMAIEHIPSLYDGGATYPFEGIAVKPLQGDIQTVVPASSFVPRAVSFDADVDYLTGTSAVTTTSSGLISFWFKNNATSWVQSKTIFESRASGGTIKTQIRTNSSGRIDLKVDGTTTNRFLSFSDNASTPFAVGAWYHVIVSWDANGGQMFVNNAPSLSSSFTSLNIGDLESFGLSADTIGRFGEDVDIGHFWLDFNTSLDASLQATRDLFVTSGGQPADVGANGEIPKGSTPDFYFDGDATNFNNKGSAGTLNLTGTLVDSVPEPSYGV